MLTGKHLLILDLDETLVYGTEDPLEHAPDFRVEPYHLYRRPFLAEFLAAAAQWYELAVWSSASPPYVHGVVREVFEDPSVLRFVWASSRCTLRCDHEQYGYYWLKDLRKVKRAGYPLERVLMLDDTPRKLERHYGNLLRIRPFTGDLHDTQLRDVLPFLQHLSTHENLRTVEKRNWRGL